MKNEIIKVTQLPIIEERLHALKSEIEARVSTALAMECTDTTLKEVKQMRTTLRKELDEFEQRRKDVKAKIEAPYKAFEEIYKECVSNAYKNADAELKCKIDSVEAARKVEKLKKVKVNQNYGIIIDKLTQRLYLYKDGHLETSLAVSTGKYNPSAKKQQPYNETRSGEFLIIYTKTGSLNDEDSGMVCSYALKFNAADYIHEVPHRKNADGTKNFRGFEEVLGTRASHGCIRVQAKKNQDGYSMAILAGLIKKEKTPVKLVVWEDYQGRQVTIPRDDTPLYYNPNKGTMYHAVADCASVNKKFLPLTSFTFAELDDAPYSKLKACPFCVPTPRRAALEEINAEHLETSPGDVMSVYGKK